MRLKHTYMYEDVAQLIKALPPSKMEYPSSFRDRVKYWVWRFYTPIHPLIRNLSTFLGITAATFVDLKDEGRQDYLIGILRSDRSVYKFVLYLVDHGFNNHFVAWKDAGEIVSLRKTVGFRYQYHIRVFADGEVRCHYEYTPEYRPLQHLLEVGFEDRTPEFRTIIGDWVVPA
jgi:hypothetical protein